MSGGLRCCLNPGLGGGAEAARRRRGWWRSSAARRRGRWFSSGSTSTGVVGGGLQGWASGNCVHCQHFPWSGSPVARRRGWWRLLDVDEETPGRSPRVVALVGRVGRLETVDIINNFPGQAHRWLVDEG